MADLFRGEVWDCSVLETHMLSCTAIMDTARAVDGIPMHPMADDSAQEQAYGSKVMYPPETVYEYVQTHQMNPATDQNLMDDAEYYFKEIMDDFGV